MTSWTGEGGIKRAGTVKFVTDQATKFQEFKLNDLFNHRSLVNAFIHLIIHSFLH